MVAITGYLTEWIHWSLALVIWNAVVYCPGTLVIKIGLALFLKKEK